MYDVSVTFKGLMAKVKVLKEQYPYRMVEKGILDNGHPDYYIQKWNEFKKTYLDMYPLDNSYQLAVCLDDEEYVKWLDCDTVSCYKELRGDVVKGHK